MARCTSRFASHASASTGVPPSRSRARERERDVYAPARGCEGPLKHSSDPWPHLGGHGGTGFVSRNGPGRRRCRGGCSRLRRRRDLQFRPAGAVAGRRPSRPVSPAARCRPRPMSSRCRKSTVPACAGSSGLCASRACRAAGSGGARSDHRLPADAGARPLGQQLGAARGLSLFRAARGRDQADRFLWLPRPQRQPFGASSEHAFGNALDIAGFRLAGGDEVSVVRGWWKGSPRERAFLQDGDGRRLRRVLHRARAGQRPPPLQPHPRRSPADQCQERTSCLPAVSTRGVPVAEAEQRAAAAPLRSRPLSFSRPGPAPTDRNSCTLWPDRHVQAGQDQV